MPPSSVPANIYLFKVNKRNTRKRCEICSKLTIKTPERRQEVKQELKTVIKFSVRPSDPKSENVWEKSAAGRVMMPSDRN